MKTKFRIVVLTLALLLGACQQGQPEAVVEFGSEATSTRGPAATSGATLSVTPTVAPPPTETATVVPPTFEPPTAVPTPVLPAFYTTAFEQWTFEVADQARGFEQATKWKGQSTAFVESAETSPGVSVQSQGAYVMFTGHGTCTFGDQTVVYQYKAGTLYILIFENQTAAPVPFKCSGIPADGTSLADYHGFDQDPATDDHPSMANLAGVALLDPLNHHCGYDCDTVGGVHFIMTPDGKVARTDYNFLRAKMVYAPMMTSPAP
ncbi:MAG: hypothetical protein AAB443_02800 [Patescibacteria group bacterium]